MNTFFTSIDKQKNVVVKVDGVTDRYNESCLRIDSDILQLRVFMTRDQLRSIVYKAGVFLTGSICGGCGEELLRPDKLCRKCRAEDKEGVECGVS